MWDILKKSFFSILNRWRIFGGSGGGSNDLKIVWNFFSYVFIFVHGKTFSSFSWQDTTIVDWFFMRGVFSDKKPTETQTLGHSEKYTHLQTQFLGFFEASRSQIYYLIHDYASFSTEFWQTDWQQNDDSRDRLKLILSWKRCLRGVKQQNPI